MLDLLIVLDLQKMDKKLKIILGLGFVILSQFLFIYFKSKKSIVGQSVINHEFSTQLGGNTESTNINCKLNSSVFKEFSLYDGGPPIGYCSIDSNGILEYKVYPFKLKVSDNFLATDNSGGVKSERLIKFSLKSGSSDPRSISSKWIDKDLDLKIQDEILKTDPNILLKRKAVEISPSLFVDGGFIFSTQRLKFNSSVGVGLSLINAGKIVYRGTLGPCNSQFKFLKLGVDYSMSNNVHGIDKISGVFTPIMINTGIVTKRWTNNIYLSPNFTFNKSGVGVGLGLSLSL